MSSNCPEIALPFALPGVGEVSLHQDVNIDVMSDKDRHVKLGRSQPLLFRYKTGNPGWCNYNKRGLSPCQSPVIKPIINICLSHSSPLISKIKHWQTSKRASENRSTRVRDAGDWTWQTSSLGPEVDKNIKI